MTRQYTSWRTPLWTIYVSVREKRFNYLDRWLRTAAEEYLCSKDLRRHRQSRYNGNVASSGEPVRLTERQIQSISRALADPRRFEILREIATHSCIACADLRREFPITPATLSHHLKELETCGLIQVTKRGKFIDTVFQRDVWNKYVAELNGL